MGRPPSSADCQRRLSWEDWTFRLGAGMLMRLPSAAEYALAVDKEHWWLPALAPRLPLPVPVPLAKGGPGAGYPYSWSVYQWLDGEPASADRIAAPVRFAVDLAGFLTAVRAIDPAHGPRPGKHNGPHDHHAVLPSDLTAYPATFVSASLMAAR